MSNKEAIRHFVNQADGPMLARMRYLIEHDPELSLHLFGIHLPPAAFTLTERAATVAALRQLCEDHGFSNDWQDGDNLADVIQTQVAGELDREINEAMDEAEDDDDDASGAAKDRFLTKIEGTFIAVDPADGDYTASLIAFDETADIDENAWGAIQEWAAKPGSMFIEATKDLRRWQYASPEEVDHAFDGITSEVISGRIHDTAAEAARAAAATHHTYPDRPSVPFTAPGSRRITIGACAEDAARIGKVNGSAMNVGGEWFEAETLLWIDLVPDADGVQGPFGVLAVRVGGWNVLDGNRLHDCDGKPLYPNW